MAMHGRVPPARSHCSHTRRSTSTTWCYRANHGHGQTPAPALTWPYTAPTRARPRTSHKPAPDARTALAPTALLCSPLPCHLQPCAHGAATPPWPCTQATALPPAFTLTGHSPLFGEHPHTQTPTATCTSTTSWHCLGHAARQRCRGPPRRGWAHTHTLAHASHCPILAHVVTKDRGHTPHMHEGSRPPPSLAK